MSTRKIIRYGVKELEKELGPLTFGRLLEAYRLADEMSLKDFAKLLGISSASLCDIEKGRRIPSPQRAASIARKLKETEAYWVQLALQDQLNQQGLKLKVSIA